MQFAHRSHWIRRASLATVLISAHTLNQQAGIGADAPDTKSSSKKEQSNRTGEPLTPNDRAVQAMLKSKPDFIVDSAEFYAELNNSAGQMKYDGKIVEYSGSVGDLHVDRDGRYTVVLLKDGSEDPEYRRFTGFRMIDMRRAIRLTFGQTVTLRGRFRIPPPRGEDGPADGELALHEGVVVAAEPNTLRHVDILTLAREAQTDPEKSNRTLLRVTGVVAKAEPIAAVDLTRLWIQGEGQQIFPCEFPVPFHTDPKVRASHPVMGARIGQTLHLVGHAHVAGKRGEKEVGITFKNCVLVTANGDCLNP